MGTGERTHSLPILPLGTALPLLMGALGPSLCIPPWATDAHLTCGAVQVNRSAP